MENPGRCLCCEKTDQEAPILRVFFRENETAIYSSCLPILIHRPHGLAGKLEGAETIHSLDHEHPKAHWCEQADARRVAKSKWLRTAHRHTSRRKGC
jgi:hypothetical protein